MATEEGLGLKNFQIEVVSITDSNVALRYHVGDAYRTVTLQEGDVLNMKLTDNLMLAAVTQLITTQGPEWQRSRSSVSQAKPA